MGDKTAIAWTDATWNPVRGCSRVSAGCVNCYAERQAIRHAGPGRSYEGLVRTVNGHPAWTGQILTVPALLDWPLRWRGHPVAHRDGRASRIFVNSMSDLFHEGVPDEFIAKVFAVMAVARDHTFQVLTKRPERMLAWFHQSPPCYLIGSGLRWLAESSAPGWARATALVRAAQHLRLGANPAIWPIPNVHLGVSVEDQATADERIPLLLQTPAAVRFVSYEPALGPVDFTRIEAVKNSRRRCGIRIDALAGRFVESGCPENRLNWLIAGGESGPGARPCNVEWIRSAVRQCREAGVPCFVKQLGRFPCVPTAEHCPSMGPELHALGDAINAQLGGPGYPLHLRDRKGADSAEWPEDLRVQEFPA